MDPLEIAKMTSSSRQVSYGTLSPPGCRSTLATWTSNRPPASSLYLHLLEASPLFTPPIILWYSLIFTSTTNNKGRDNDGNMTRTVKSVTSGVDTASDRIAFVDCPSYDSPSVVCTSIDTLSCFFNVNNHRNENANVVVSCI